MSSKRKNHKVVIIMGSQSDYATMQYCQKVLKILKIKHEIKIISAHRTPVRMYKFAKKATGSSSTIYLPSNFQTSLTSLSKIFQPNYFFIILHIPSTK